MDCLPPGASRKHSSVIRNRNADILHQVSGKLSCCPIRVEQKSSIFPSADLVVIIYRSKLGCPPAEPYFPPRGPKISHLPRRGHHETRPSLPASLDRFCPADDFLPARRRMGPKPAAGQTESASTRFECSGSRGHAAGHDLGFD